MPTLISPAWNLCRGPTPIFGRGSQNSTTAAGSGPDRPGRATAESAVVPLVISVFIRPITSRGAKRTDPFLTGSNSITAATTPKFVPVANASTGAASIRIMSALSATPTTCARQSRTGVRPVTTTPRRIPTSTRTTRAVARVAPADPAPARAKRRELLSGSGWASAQAAPGGPASTCSGHGYTTRTVKTDKVVYYTAYLPARSSNDLGRHDHDLPFPGLPGRRLPAAADPR